MCAGRGKRCRGLRLILLVAVVRIQAAEATTGSDKNVVLIIAVVGFIFLTSLVYVTVSCGYYHCVYKTQLVGKEAAAKEDIIHPTVSATSSSERGATPYSSEGAERPEKSVENRNRSLPVGKSEVEHLPANDLLQQEGCDEHSAHERGLGPSDLDLPEVLHPEGAGTALEPDVADNLETRTDSGAENVPPIAQIRRPPPGIAYAKSSSSLQLENTHLNEAQDIRCCTVFDMCSPSWSLGEGLPPATAMAGPPSAPRAPAAMPRGRLQL
jgi:hypothetical protein